MRYTAIKKQTKELTMKKQYATGYNYELHAATLIRPSMLVLSNVLPFGKGRLEAQIFFDQGAIRVLLTNGYDNLYDKTGFLSIKQALNIIHGKMQDLTHCNKSTTL